MSWTGEVEERTELLLRFRAKEWEVASFADMPLLPGGGGAGPAFLRGPPTPATQAADSASLFRSMEFEQPVFHTGGGGSQLTQPFGSATSKGIRPVFRASNEEMVADSMPAFPVHHSYPDVMGGGRIRRKSETCV